eukprot:3284077-Pleurochrysis_carterae.AAC.1
MAQKLKMGERRDCVRNWLWQSNVYGCVCLRSCARVCARACVSSGERVRALACARPACMCACMRSSSCACVRARERVHA